MTYWPQKGKITWFIKSFNFNGHTEGSLKGFLHYHLVASASLRYLRTSISSRVFEQIVDFQAKSSHIRIALRGNATSEFSATTTMAGTGKNYKQKNSESATNFLAGFFEAL